MRNLAPRPNAATGRRGSRSPARRRAASDPASPAGADHFRRQLGARSAPMRSSTSSRGAKASRSPRRPSIVRSTSSSSTASCTRSRAATPMRPASTSGTPTMACCSCARSADGATRSRTSGSTVYCRKRPPAPALRHTGKWSNSWACVGTACAGRRQRGCRIPQRASNSSVRWPALRLC